MNRQVHLVIGIVLFLVYAHGAGLFYRAAGTLLVFGILAVVAGSLLPDILEPATGARHRGICHGRRALGFAGMAFFLTAIPVLFSPTVPRLSLVFTVSSFFLGYASHLLADSLTRAGLPG
jgi:membrane-bound metal-dependent hydrolase YbcI (DUF457 family)